MKKNDIKIFYIAYRLKDEHNGIKKSAIIVFKYWVIKKIHFKFFLITFLIKIIFKYFVCAKVHYGKSLLFSFIYPSSFSQKKRTSAARSAYL